MQSTSSRPLEGDGEEVFLDILFHSAAEPQPKHDRELSAISSWRSALAAAQTRSFVVIVKSYLLGRSTG
jgi:hypothetical protein